MSLLYCQPSATIDNLESLRSVLFKLADVQIREVIILGDTNLPNIDWVNHFSKDTKGTVLLELCLQLNHGLLNLHVTTMSLILSCLRQPILFNICKFCRLLVIVIITQFTFYYKMICRQGITSPALSLYQFFSSADYDSIRLVLQSIYWPAFFADCRTINDYWLKLLHYLYSLINEFVPFRRNKLKSALKAYVPKRIRKLISKCNCSWKFYKSSKSDALRIEWKQARSRLHHSIRDWTRHNEERVVRSGSNK